MCGMNYFVYCGDDYKGCEFLWFLEMSRNFDNMENLNPTTKTPLKIDDKESGILSSPNEIQEDVSQDMQRDTALCKIPFGENSDSIPEFISTMPHSAVNLYSSFHSSSERLELLNNVQHFKRKFFDFAQQQNDIQVKCSIPTFLMDNRTKVLWRKKLN